MELWYSPSEETAIRFLIEFEPYYKNLRSYIDFHPRFVIWPCDDCASSKIANDCLYNGKYCALDPDGAGPFTGVAIINETLRQSCLAQCDTVTYIDYVALWNVNCLHHSLNFSEQCSFEQILELEKKNKSLLIDVESCLSESKVYDDGVENDNSILSQAIYEMEQAGIMFYPSVTINNFTYIGKLNALDITDGVCTALPNYPNQCHLIETGKNHNHYLFYTGLIVILASFFIIAMALIFYCRARIREQMSREMKYQVSTLVSQYMVLQDKKSQNHIALDD